MDEFLKIYDPLQSSAHGADNKGDEWFHIIQIKNEIRIIAVKL